MSNTKAWSRVKLVRRVVDEPEKNSWEQETASLLEPCICTILQQGGVPFSPSNNVSQGIFTRYLRDHIIRYHCPHFHCPPPSPLTAAGYLRYLKGRWQNLQLMAAHLIWLGF
ncbi:hypothetical protein J6590_063006 [Homalodisca vitripennis]|nr:hypothetical protein J6590_063006 [Homalodisca vitripennis]